MFELVLVVSGLIIIALVVFLLLNNWKLTEPGKAMLISGRIYREKQPDGSTRTVDYRVITKGRAFVWPILEQIHTLSLDREAVSVTTSEIHTASGIPVTVEITASVKVKEDEDSIRAAAERFLPKTPEDMRRIVGQAVRGRLETLIAQTGIEELHGNCDHFQKAAAETASKELTSMGMTVEQVVVKNVHRGEDSYLIGGTAEVTMPIPGEGLGQITYFSRGVECTTPARSTDGTPIPERTIVTIDEVQDQEVFVSKQNPGEEENLPSPG